MAFVAIRCSFVKQLSVKNVDDRCIAFPHKFDVHVKYQFPRIGFTRFFYLICSSQPVELGGPQPCRCHFAIFGAAAERLFNFSFAEVESRIIRDLLSEHSQKVRKTKR